METTDKSGIDELQKRLKKLHLSGMAEQLGALAEDGSIAALSAESVLNMLTIEENHIRQNRKTKRLIGKSSLYYPSASVPGIINDKNRKINLSLLDSLLMCGYIEHSQPVWIQGSSGTGKTYISCVLGKQACLLLYSVKYYTTSEFFAFCSEAEALGRLQNFITETCKNNLIILDDFLLTGVNFNEAKYLYELLNFPPNQKHPRSVIVATQLMEEEIRLRLSDVSPALSEAIVSRLKAKALYLEISGKNMRN